MTKQSGQEQQESVAVKIGRMIFIQGGTGWRGMVRSGQAGGKASKLPLRHTAAIAAAVWRWLAGVL